MTSATESPGKARVQASKARKEIPAFLSREERLAAGHAASGQRHPGAGSGISNDWPSASQLRDATAVCRTRFVLRGNSKKYLKLTSGRALMGNKVWVPAIPLTILQETAVQMRDLCASPTGILVSDLMTPLRCGYRRRRESGRRHVDDVEPRRAHARRDERRQGHRRRTLARRCSRGARPGPDAAREHHPL